MRINKSTLSTLGLVLAGVLLLAFSFGRIFVMHGSPEDRTCTVTDVDLRANGDKDGLGHKYMIRTEECGDLQVKGGIMWGSMFPGQVVRDLNEGETYVFSTVGERSVWLHTFPTVKDVAAK